jgi:hypothetical protein
MLSLKDHKEHTRLTAVVLRTGKYSAQLKRLFLTKYLIWSDVKTFLFTFPEEIISSWNLNIHWFIN